MLPWFTLTVFVSATLLFLIQPMFARMVLPMLGGSPSVWNTALVFYQTTLLAGYAYAHFATRRLSPRQQSWVQLALVLGAFLCLPIAVPRGATPPTTHSPVGWMLGVMVVAVGLPFFVLSTTGPLIQRWFSASGHRSAGDPYFLYAASNLGSLLGLLSYPILLEPRLRLAEQSGLWSGGYGLLVVLMAGCALAIRRVRPPEQQKAAPRGKPIPWARRARWVLLAFVPSSLMLGVTTHITTDVAAIPLLWVLPLALYLVSFVLVFASRPPLPHARVVRLLPLVLLPLLILMQARATQPLLLIVSLHLLVLFVAAMVCHGELARDRPPAERLTEFYLWLAVGGALGGAFNALIAPIVFQSIAEYPIALVLACLMMPPRDTSTRWRDRVLDVVVPVVIGLGTVGFAVAYEAQGLPLGSVAVAILIAVLAFPLFAASRRPLRFGLCIAALLLADPAGISTRQRVLHQERSFFGVYRVMLDGSRTFHDLVHGTTLHGTQRVSPLVCDEPLGYYHRKGPLGDVFRALDAKGAGNGARQVALAGLGAGEVAAYAHAGERWRFYEIDPAVKRIANDPEYFCLLGACPADVDVVLGDARRSLAAVNERYDLILLDAYTSDAIPVHLITREALRLYLDRLAPHGVIALHLSNRSFDLVPVVVSLAEDAKLAYRVRWLPKVTKEEEEEPVARSTWAVVARDTADLGPLASDPRWSAPKPRAGLRPWTDDYSSLLSVLRWK